MNVLILHAIRIKERVIKFQILLPKSYKFNEIKIKINLTIYTKTVF